MSIYSGFGTRQQETTYNLLIENTIHLLQTKVVANLKNESENENLFKMQLLKNYDMLVKLEAHKYLQPKFSESIKETVVYIIRGQINSPKSPSEFMLNFKESDNMKKSATSMRISEFYTERSLTPTLPYVKKPTKKYLTPVRSKKNDSGFLFARLKN